MVLLVVRIPPAFLIRQKSEIIDTFPPGEGFGELLARVFTLDS